MYFLVVIMMSATSFATTFESTLQQFHSKAACEEVKALYAIAYKMNEPVVECVFDSHEVINEI